MKKKLKIDLLYKGQENENLAVIIGQHNSGVNPVSLEDIASYLWVRRSILESYGSCTKTDPYNKDVHGSFLDDDKTKLYINEKNKCVAIIEEIEVTPLNENDLNGALFTSEKQEETIL